MTQIPGKCDNKKPLIRIGITPLALENEITQIIHETLDQVELLKLLVKCTLTQQASKQPHHHDQHKMRKTIFVGSCKGSTFWTYGLKIPIMLSWNYKIFPKNIYTCNNLPSGHFFPTHHHDFSVKSQVKVK